MEDALTKLKDSIVKGDLATADALISLDVSSMRNLLDQNINGENGIELALRYGYQDLALKMLVKSTNNAQLTCEEFTWPKLFDLVSGKKTTFSQLKKQLKYATPFFIRENFPLATLTRKPKYIKTAIALGAVCRDAQGLGQAIVDSSLWYRAKLELLDWLVENKHVTSLPVPPKKLFLLLRGSHVLQTRLLNWFLEQDPLGNTIVHYITQTCGVRVSTFNKIWADFKVQTKNHPAKLIAAASLPNNAGEIPAIQYLAKYLGFAVFPVEFVAALKHIAQSPTLCVYLQKYALQQLHCDTNNTAATLLYLYILQQGKEQGHDMTALQNFLELTTRCDDFSKLLHFKTNPKKEIDVLAAANEPTAKNQQNPILNEEFFLHLLAIPPELFKEIILLLSPAELTKLFNCSKKMKAELQLMFEGNELLWRRYHLTHFRYQEKVHVPYKTLVQQNLKANSGWRQNKYTTIEMTGLPQLMDENWLVLSTKFEEKSHLGPNFELSFWNCHSQQISDITTKIYDTFVLLYYNVLRSSGYDGSSHSPKLLIGATVADQAQLRIYSGNDFVSLNIPKDIGPYLSSTTFARVRYLSENNLLFIPGTKDVSIYDIEREEISAKFPRLENILPNPYNSTFVSLPHWLSRDLTVVDWKSGEKTIFWQLESNIKDTDFRSAHFVDEHTLFFSGVARNHFQSYRCTQASIHGCIDLRTGKELFSVSHLAQTAQYQYVTASSERVFIHSRNWPLVSAWHLPTRKLEWIQPTEHTPRLANSRYLVMSDAESNSKLFVRDYASW